VDYVEVATPTGWFGPWPVVDQHKDFLTYQLADGTRRKVIKDLTRSPTPYWQGWVKSQNWPRYGQDMELLSDPKFNVSLPKGSASYALEVGLVDCTEELNRAALRVDLDIWRKNWSSLTARAELAAVAAEKASGMFGFRANSPKDCREVFIAKRGLTPLHVTPKGSPSIDMDCLKAWADQGDSLAPLVMESREAITKLSQLEGWRQYASEGKVQANWNQLGQPHGRYSCDSPNLQSRILEVRETVVAHPGYQFVSLDLGQAEYLTWASLSKDPLLSSIFRSGQDLHQAMFDSIKEELPGFKTDNPRKTGKTINFALLYLMKPYSLAGQLGCSTEEALRIMGIYSSRAPRAVEYINETLNEITARGFTETAFGRRRQAKLADFKGPALHEARKTAWHHHNAGTAAELLKIKQLRLWTEMRKNFSQEQARMVIQFHDEIILEVREDVLSEVQQLSLQEFKRPIDGFLDFAIDQRTGSNWLTISK
jgi:DNA polymerase-1